MTFWITFLCLSPLSWWFLRTKEKRLEGRGGGDGEQRFILLFIYWTNIYWAPMRRAFYQSWFCTPLHWGGTTRLRRIWKAILKFDHTRRKREYWNTRGEERLKLFYSAVCTVPSQWSWHILSCLCSFVRGELSPWKPPFIHLCSLKFYLLWRPILHASSCVELFQIYFSPYDLYIIWTMLAPSWFFFMTLILFHHMFLTTEIAFPLKNKW